MGTDPLQIAILDKTYEDEMQWMTAELKGLTKPGAIRLKALYLVEDVAFLTGFSTLTVYRWINEGRRINGGKKIVYLKPAKGIVDRGCRIFPDELDYFLSLLSTSASIVSYRHSSISDMVISQKVFFETSENKKHNWFYDF